MAPLVLTANTAPAPALPPPLAVPYRVSLDRITPPRGLAPSLMPVKLYQVAKLVPSVLRANTEPKPEVPPYVAVPYKALPDKNRVPDGLAPSLLVALGPE